MKESRTSKKLEVASKASCPLPCSAHVAVFCSIHCDGLTHPDGNEAGVAVGSFNRGADGADAVPDLCDIGWSSNDSAAWWGSAPELILYLVEH